MKREKHLQSIEPTLKHQKFNSGSIMAQVTLTLSDETYERAKRFAKLANRDLESVLSDAIYASIPFVRPEAEELGAIANLSNEEILALTELQMEPEEDSYLSELLDKQQAGTLSDAERPELQRLMQIYQEGLLRKATALQEAVRRGLTEPLSS
jgi:hypothetical protein